MKIRLLALAFLLSGALTLAAETKNILLIITDNQNWFDLGC